MRLETVGIVSPGDMGSGIGQALVQGGLRVVAALDGRSERTQRLAREAGIDNVGSLPALVQEADIVLSVVVPSAALDVAAQVADAMHCADARPLYADCNAISVDTKRAVAERIYAVNGRFVDASIIGPPPRKPGLTRIYAAGESVDEFAALSGHGLDVRVLGGEIGKAASIKVCYATITKVTQALMIKSLVAAMRLGVFEPLLQEIDSSQKGLLRMIGGLGTVPPRAHRFVGEMEEQALTYNSLGLTPQISLGAADMYRAIADTSLGSESPEAQRLQARTLEQVLAILDRELVSG